MAKTLISTHTASSSATVDITSGIDSTYPVYEFHLHAQTDSYWPSPAVHFQFQVNAAGGSGFNETMTTTFIQAYQSEAGDSTTFNYLSQHDQGQGTAYQRLAYDLGNDNDQSCSGILTLYDPSSTTYVKHFTSSVSNNYYANYAMVAYVAGYINTTSAIDEISFELAVGNMDAGVIKMFGVS